MDRSVRPGATRTMVPSWKGWATAAVVGALSTGIVVLVWVFLAAVMGGLDPTAPTGWALLTGFAVGLGVVALRHDKDTPALPVLGLGLVAGAAWLAASGLEPLGDTRPNVFWQAIACVLAFVLAAHLTRYGLRDLNLRDPNRFVLETLVLRGLRAVGYVFFLGIVVFPFYFMIAASMKSRARMLQDPADLSIAFGRPLGELLVGYREVLVTFDFLRYIGNSTFVAITTVIITLVLAVLGAYAVTRLRFPGRTFMSRSILLIYMFPAIVLVIPLYTVFTQLGLRNTLPGLLIVYPATTIPVALYMLRSYFQTLPRDLEEAGMIDGCSRLGVIWRITLPLSLPALASVGLYVFMIAWNEFLFAFMFLDSPAIFTLSRGMVALNTQEVPRQFLMAGAVIVTVPIMVLFFWFERYLVGGLTSGGVKG